MIFKLYAFISTFVVKNVMAADQHFIVRVIGHYDHIINITDVKPRPQVGWYYQNGSFSKEQKTYG